MNVEVKLQKVGNSLGIVIPKEVVAKLDLHEGDTLMLIEEQDGLRIAIANPELAKTRRTFQSLDGRYRNALRDLAD